MAQPLRVAVLSLDPPESACARWRIISPLTALAPALEMSWAVRPVDGRVGVDQAALDAADLVVAQRFFPTDFSLGLLAGLMDQGRPVIYETDDLVPRIGPENENFELARKTTETMAELGPRFSLITVTTPGLAEHYAAMGPPVAVLPNLLDQRLWPQASPRPGRAVRVGYAATATHKADLEFMEDVLTAALERHAGRMRLVLFGCATKRLEAHAEVTVLPFADGFEDYARLLPRLHLHVALAPLADTAMNRCKSNVKWLEYSACGAAGVYADLPPYADVRHGETGLLAGQDPADWAEALDALVRDETLRTRLADAARREVFSRYGLAARAHEFLDAYRGLLP